MKRQYLIPAGLVAVVVVLVGVNLALREDPEPHFEEPPPPAPRSSGTPEVVAERAQDRVDEAFAAPPEEDGTTAAPDDAPSGCDHPLIPAERGQWRRYRWTQSGQDQVAVLRIRADRTRAVGDEEREVRWHVRTGSEEGDVEPTEGVLTTRCRPGEDSEDPWFGILEVLGLGARLLDEPGRWRWPAELARGQRFEGVTHFDATNARARMPDGVAGPLTLQVRRTHEVEGQEAIEVPAGRFTAWRVVFEHQQSFGDRQETGSGTLWIAPDVGLVKSRLENEAGLVQTLELTRIGNQVP